MTVPTLANNLWLQMAVLGGRLNPPCGRLYLVTSGYLVDAREEYQA
jgi:hypothetical protein